MMGLLEANQFFQETGCQVVDLGFDFLVADDIAAWTKTDITGGTCAAKVGVVNGQIEFSGAATTDNTGAQLQNPYSPIKLEANGWCSMRFRFYKSQLASEFLFGLCILDTSLVASAPTDGVYLHIAEDTGIVSLKVIRDSTAVTKVLGVTAGFAEWENWGINIRCGADPLNAQIDVWKDGVKVWSSEAEDYTFEDFPYDQVLTPSMAFQSGSDVGTQTRLVDYAQFRYKRYLS
jgi:hypothetical protein